VAKGTTREHWRKENRALDDAHHTEADFAHPTEEAFARILDYYGIEWEYEPRTFVLERYEDGRIAEGFSPDFYLPQQDLYVELTTVRPSLVTVKNRKVRRLRELYPEVNIKLFKRRDVRDLMIKYGLDAQAENILGTEAQEE
jgi:hypoxanthine phosphoribosyltransferase